jgi:uncharacterized protein YwgA
MKQNNVKQETYDEIDDYKWLAAVIAAHPDATVRGSERLQHTIMLLQHFGFPSSYGYTKFFYGPYSDAVHADLVMLDTLRIIKMEESLSDDGHFEEYIFTASDESLTNLIGEYISKIVLISKKEASVLDYAATYRAFRELGSSDEKAWKDVCRKKGQACDENTTREAMKLLEELSTHQKPARKRHEKERSKRTT